MINSSKKITRFAIFWMLQAICLSAYADSLSVKKASPEVIASSKSAREIAVNADQERMNIKNILHHEIIGHLPDPAPRSKRDLGIADSGRTETPANPIPQDNN